MNNTALSLVALRNTALIWIGVTIFALLGAWWVHGFFTAGTSYVGDISTLEKSITLIEEEGVVTSKNWEELSAEAKKTERWTTMSRLVPAIQKMVGTGTVAAKNTTTMKTISQKVGSGSYIDWLRKSWEGQSQTELTQTLSDIAEIIPLFAGISELTSTEQIGGKITLSTLVNYIQNNIAENYGLGNALGEIGIDGVEFLPDSDIGMYEVPLQFLNVPNNNITNLLAFLKETGGVKITEGKGSITIEHLNPKPITDTLPGESSLKNLLITVQEMVVMPSAVEGRDISEIPVSTNARGNWDVRITLLFYIRGVSRDHITSLDNKILSLLDKNGSSESLITRANAVLKACNTCIYSLQIKDIINLLTDARSVYDNIIIQEKNPKNTFTPIEILKHRTELMTSVDALKGKLESLEGLLSTT